MSGIVDIWYAPTTISMIASQIESMNDCGMLLYGLYSIYTFVGFIFCSCAESNDDVRIDNSVYATLRLVADERNSEIVAL